MTYDVTDRPPVHALFADGTTVCIRPVVSGDHDQVEGCMRGCPQRTCA